MKMSKSTTITVRDYTTGRTIGRIRISTADYAAYEAGTLDGVQYPEGIISLSDLLDLGRGDDALVEADLDSTVYLD